MSRQDFEVLILGSSSASPAQGRNVSGQFINIARRFFLVDCGEGTQIQLRRFNARIQSISHIFISHLHGDHFFGLPGLLGTMHLLGRKTTLHIYCPADLKTIVENINRVSQTVLNFKIAWHFTSDEGMQLVFEDPKVEVFSFPLKHRIFCTGFLFREKPLPRKIDKYQVEKNEISLSDIRLLQAGMDVTNRHGALIKNSQVTLDPPPPRSYAYCSDTMADPSLTQYISSVNLLYHESTFLEEHRERAAKTFHSTAQQAAAIAAGAGVQKLLLGHFSARYGDLEAFIKEASPLFENCELATEGKKIKI